jgi:HEAT repeat protein
MQMTKGICFALLSACLLVPSAMGDAVKSSSEIDILYSGLKDSNRDIRATSAKYLGEVGNKYAIPQLKELLADTHDAVRIRAAVALYQLGDKSGAAELRKILSTKPRLSETPTPIERVKAVQRNTIRAEAAVALGEIKDAGAVSLLQTMLEDDDGRVADASMISLARLGDSSSKQQFLSALERNRRRFPGRSAVPVGCSADGSGRLQSRRT